VKNTFVPPESFPTSGKTLSGFPKAPRHQEKYFRGSGKFPGAVKNTFVLPESSPTSGKMLSGFRKFFPTPWEILSGFPNGFRKATCDVREREGPAAVKSGAIRLSYHFLILDLKPFGGRKLSEKPTFAQQINN
jgi:hypothetical protein